MSAGDTPIRQLTKALAHGAHYSTGPAAFVQGASGHTIIHDEIQFKVDKDEFAAAGAGLSSAEWCWAVAFRKALGCGPEFYERAARARRRQLEQHYVELAMHDTQKGRRAARVVKVFVEYKLRGGGS